jgi:oligopeptide/dipeptide ABC transporter ATP-binding protein
MKAGETVGLVGESGCGKSVTARSLMRLIPTPPGNISGGQVLFEGRDLLSVSEAEMRKIRGNHISMIFQDPMTSLNPVFKIRFQLEEVLALHQPELSREQRRERALEMMRKVKIPSPEQRLEEYPHQLSGGMRQRVMIAMALACRPTLLLADEPTTALDVTVQAQILKLMNELKEDIGTSILLITHDLGVVAEVCDRVLVMYLGQVVESGTVEEIFTRPQHPYTMRLMESIPKMQDHRVEGARLQTIRGIVPSLHNIPRGCSFQERCDVSQSKCRDYRPDLTASEGRTDVRCFFPQNQDS